MFSGWPGGKGAEVLQAGC